MDISVIIPVYNRFIDLQRCLASIERQVGCSFEVIVIDDGSSDGDYSTFESPAHHVSVVTAGCSAGPGYARNMGIVRASGTFLLFLDSDTVLPNKQIFTHFIDFFAQHADAGCVGGEIRCYRGNTNHVYGQKFCENNEKRDVALAREAGLWTGCDYLATCCCMVRAEHAREAGGFDPYFAFGNEDTDFGYRIHKRGLHNYLVTDCAVEHNHSLSGRKPDETYRYHFTGLRFIIKHGTVARILWHMAAMVLGAMLFYLLMVPKLLWLAVSGAGMVKENVSGGFLMVKALVSCLADYAEIRNSADRDFLDPAEMGRYRQRIKK